MRNRNNDVSSRLIDNQLNDDIDIRTNPENGPIQRQSLRQEPVSSRRVRNKKQRSNYKKDKSKNDLNITSDNDIKQEQFRPRKKYREYNDCSMDSGSEISELYNEAVTQETEEIANSALEKKRTKRYRIVNGALILVCIYVIYLIFGVFVTSYHYDAKGHVVPQVMTVSELKEKKDFDVILNQYIQCRSLYEKVLLLDYQYSKGAKDVQVLGPEYGELVEGSNQPYNCANIDLKLAALSVNDKYSSLKNAMLNWLENDMAVYLRDMSSGITNNLESALTEADRTRDSVYYDFSNITSNIVTLGENIKGVDIVNVQKWTPQNYVDEQVNGGGKT